MDFGKALLLSGLLFALVTMVYAVFPVLDSDKRWKVATVLVLAFVATFTMRYTVWAHEQVVGGHPLDELDFGSLAVASVFLAAGSSLVAELVKMVKNVGANQIQKPTVK